MSVKWDTNGLTKKVNALMKRNTKMAAFYLVGEIKKSFGSPPKQQTRGSIKAQRRYVAKLEAYNKNVALVAWRKQERVANKIKAKNDRAWKRESAKSERLRTASFRKKNFFQEL